MSYDKPIRRIAIVGTGVIGASWAAQYLARGFDVVATDPAPNAEENLRKYVDKAWEQLTAIGLAPGASRDRLSFTTNMKEALANADFVQENAPERPEFKIKLFAEMDDATPVDSIIASSSSGITPSVMQSNASTRSVSSSGIPSIRPTSSRWLKSWAGRRHRPRPSNGRWHSMRPSARNLSCCTRSFPGMSRTGCRLRCTRRSCT